MKILVDGVFDAGSCCCHCRKRCARGLFGIAVDNAERIQEGLEQLVEHPEIKIYGTNVGCGDLKDVGISIDQFVAT